MRTYASTVSKLPLQALEAVRANLEQLMITVKEAPMTVALDGVVLVMVNPSRITKQEQGLSMNSKLGRKQGQKK
jgi:hypothetical protein